ncbi:hypothetical protein [Pseudomonas viridiflava]|uniref:hypothetical protein n=1 Tax=Pseudomonas viridiflava TaxID=33069 RepID=UPI0013CE5569|nr:hypothetical protein [Pseudomonas viridiflava]MEE3925415.1 hypothetical protein [Pseudomonas viridiflava]MEE3931856.1 hypothetical protein [Pseudomonas viridiflava]MEE3942542.1 hypothetical protein [Pseudomonas viridiflava]MEE3968427.1 hypothetical protein [Pseudomonas viridiflava]MEE3982653.1 hypothetical protein [Pseudomonas viridiflava]
MALYVGQFRFDCLDCQRLDLNGSGRGRVDGFQQRLQMSFPGFGRVRQFAAFLGCLVIVITLSLSQLARLISLLMCWDIVKLKQVLFAVVARPLR